MAVYKTDGQALRLRMETAKSSEAYLDLCRLRNLVKGALDGDLVLEAAHRRADAGAFYLLSRGAKKTSDNLARSAAEQVFCGLMLDGEDAAANRYLDISSETINNELARTFSKSGFVYFLLDERERTIKIGYTISIRDRMSALQTKAPFKRNLLLAIKGTELYEQELHIRFAQWRIRDNGEWFYDCPEIRAFIDQSAVATLTQVGTV